MIAGNIRQLFDAFQKISDFSKGVFGALGCGVGNFCEDTKRRNIGEIAVIELADITGKRTVLCNGVHELSSTFRQLQCSRKIVDCPAWKIGKHRLAVYFHNAADHLIPGTVPTDTDENITAARTGFCKLLRMSRILGYINLYRILHGTKPVT